MIRDRSIVALLSAELISRFGSQLTYLALPWFVLVTTGSPTKMGLVFAVELAPMALLGIPAGSVVQRLGPKVSMLVADGARAPIVAIVPFLNIVGGLTFGVILVVAALLGTFSCAYFTCQRLILPAVVGEGEQQLAQANSLVEGAGNITNLLGPALAGVLIALLGAANVMWLDAASFLIAFVIIGLFVRVGSTAARGGRRLGRDLGRALVSAPRCAARARLALEPDVRVPLSDARRLAAGARLPAVRPQPACRRPSLRGDRRRPGRRLAARVPARDEDPRHAPGRDRSVLHRRPLWLLVPHASLGVAAVALGICGASIPLINAPYLGMLSVRVPRALRGKVLQSLITINQLAGPLGYLIAGTLFVAIGLHATYALIAVLATLASLNFIVVAPRFTLAQETA